MIARRLGCWSLAWIVCMGLPLVATAQSDVLGDNVRTASNVGPFRNQIEAYIRQRTTLLSGTDAVAQSKAREELISAVAPPAAGALSAPFLQAYASILNDELVKLASHKDARVRLNAAIVAARVAEGARNASLQPATMALLKDPSDAVVWWALRSARAVLPHVLASPAAANDPLVETIVQIGQTRPGVIQAAYEALAISGLPAGSAPRVLAITVPALRSIVNSRITQYKTGIPQEPFSEVRATTYLVGKQEYEALPPAEKVGTAQAISDLLWVAAYRSGDVTPEQRAELALMIKKVGGALSVIGQWEGNQNVQQIGATIDRIHPRNVTPQELQAHVQPVYAALRGIPKFKNLTPPPKISEMTTAPGSPGAPAPATTGTAADGSR